MNIITKYFGIAGLVLAFYALMGYAKEALSHNSTAVMAINIIVLIVGGISVAYMLMS